MQDPVRFYRISGKALAEDFTVFSLIRALGGV